MRTSTGVAWTVRAPTWWEGRRFTSWYASVDPYELAPAQGVAR